MQKVVLEATKRIQQGVPRAEASIDQAMADLTNLMTVLVNARLETSVPAATGQATIRRLSKAHTAMLEASGEVLRAHDELLKIAREHAGFDIHECPDVEGADHQDKAPLSVVA